MAIDNLIETAQKLSPEQFAMLLNFAKFLEQQSEKDEQSSRAAERERILEKYKGKGWIADDFDAPLEEFKEYM